MGVVVILLFHYTEIEFSGIYRLTIDTCAIEAENVIVALENLRR
jgi:hypothetical protein